MQVPSGKEKPLMEKLVSKHFQVSDLILWAHSVIEAGPNQLMQHQIKKMLPLMTQ